MAEKEQTEERSVLLTVKHTVDGPGGDVWVAEYEPIRLRLPANATPEQFSRELHTAFLRAVAPDTDEPEPVLVALKEAATAAGEWLARLDRGEVTDPTGQLAELAHTVIQTWAKFNN